MDSRAARYAATVRVQTARTETIADLGGMVVELLKTFYQTVRTLLTLLLLLLTRRCIDSVECRSDKM